MSYAVVVAHPDDELIWFSSVIRDARRVVVCYGDVPGHPDMGGRRRRVMADYPLDNMVFLDLPEGGFHNRSDWKNPEITPYGASLAADVDRERYQRNFHQLCTRFEPLLSDVNCIFTHSPWGEYGHEDHVQIFQAVSKLLNSRPGKRICVPAWYTSNSAKLYARCTERYDLKDFAMPTSDELVVEIKSLYVANKCWTWYPDWIARHQERFFHIQGIQP